MSVIIPAYNVASVISRAIESVLEQTFSDFEVVVVDDGSTDDTASVVKQYRSDPRVRYVYQQNRGLSGARNTGIKHVSSDLVAFLDADDSWLPRKLESQYRAMQENPSAGACYVNAFHMLPHGEVEPASGKYGRDDDPLYVQLMFGPVITGSGSSMMVRRECFDKVGMFDESMSALEDRDMWLRIASQFSIIFIDVRLVEIDRTRTGRMTANPLLMACGGMHLLRNIEAGIPPQFRNELGRVRRSNYLRIAHYLSSGNEIGRCRQHCLRSLTSSWSLNREIWGSLILLGKTFIPRSVRSWIRTYVKGR